MIDIHSGYLWQSGHEKVAAFKRSNGSLLESRSSQLVLQTSAERIQKTFFASMLTYIITITLVRISILMLMRRIFDIRPFKITTSVLIAMSLAWGISIAFANIFQCTPVAGAFDPAIVMSFSKQCINLQAMYYGTLGTAVFLDTIILVLPVREIWKLQLSTRRKYEISALLSVGGLACIASFMRIVAIGNLKRTDLVCKLTTKSHHLSTLISRFKSTAAVQTHSLIFRHGSRILHVVPDRTLRRHPLRLLSHLPTLIPHLQAPQHSLAPKSQATRISRRREQAMAHHDGRERKE